LLEFSSRHAVERVEEAGDAVEEGTGAWVEGHVVERCDSEDDAGVAWSMRQWMMLLPPEGFQGLPMRLGMNKKMFSSGSICLFVVLLIPVGILGGDRAVVLGEVVVVVPFAPGLRGLRLFAIM